MSSLWRPSATIENLKARACLLKTIREFFAVRDVLEVETPVFCRASVTDPFIQSMPAYFQPHPAQAEQKYYLQTSPEYAMKRLLAAGSGSIYQITKAFRQGEVGQFHNPEFSMLEWYRVGFDHHQLMDEMDELLQATLNKGKAVRKTYAELFKEHLAIDTFSVTVDELQRCAAKHDLQVATTLEHRDDWLMLLMSHVIEPNMERGRPLFVYDFPVTQAALARIVGEPPVAARFEVYFNGVELANGFYELQQVAEQRQRFEKNVAARQSQQLPAMPIDELFLSALTQGLPDCAGVALGVDRLLMLMLNATALREVVSFDHERV